MMKEKMMSSEDFISNSRDWTASDQIHTKNRKQSQIKKKNENKNKTEKQII